MIGIAAVSIAFDEVFMTVTVVYVVTAEAVGLGNEMPVEIPPADEVSEVPHRYVL